MDARLINLSRFPNNMISGLTSDQISAEIDRQYIEDNVICDDDFSEHYIDDIEPLFGLAPDLNDENSIKDLEGK